MPRLVIRILGRFSLEAADHDASGIEVGKPQSLLCYLLLNRERAHLREALASALWGDGPTSTAQAKKQLRQALWNLQSALADLSVPPDLRTLIVETDWVRVNGAASLWLDAAAFEQIYLEVRDRPGESLDEQGAGRLREALAMYRGDLLEGCYEDWCLFERERFQNMMLTMLDKMMGYCEVRREYEAGVDFGERILRYDRASERAYRRLMRLHYLSGDRSAALRQYERCRAALLAELDAEPAAQTRLLHLRIKGDDLGDGTAATSPASPTLVTGERRRDSRASGRGEAGSNDPFGRLENSLVQLQEQVIAAIGALEAVKLEGEHAPAIPHRQPGPGPAHLHRGGVGR